MKEGGFKEGECVLRGKIDMSSSFMCMRDPVFYRVRFDSHHQTDNGVFTQCMTLPTALGMLLKE